MKLFIVLFMAFGFMLCGCKEKSDAIKPKAELPEQEILIEKPVSPVLIEMGKFADLVISDSITANELFLFKEIDDNGVVETVDENEAINLYKKMMKRDAVKSYVIFEIENTDTAILVVQGLGFGGPIWARVLVDTKTLEIKKIAFEHKAESDGYGAAMTQTSFENQFVGTKIDLEKNTFTLQKNIEKRIDDGAFIDGISGATMTSQGAIEMVNEGLKKYKGYLNP